MNSKKILLLTENFPPIEGGSGRWFWELYTRLTEHHVTILTHDIDGGRQFDNGHDLNLIRFPMSCPEWGFKSIKGLKFYWSLFRKVKSLIKSHNIDEIHCGRVIPEGVVAWLVKKVTGVPFVCFVHGEDVETAATSREQSLMVKHVCKNSEYLICNSENSANLVESLGFAARDKCVVLNPGVDTQKFRPAPPDADFRENLGWDDKIVLLTVGRLQKRKGQDYLIQALPKLLNTFPNLHYAIVGRGECEDLLRALVVEYDLIDHVSIHTDLDDEQLIKCYQQCDVFILPNRTISNDIEGFGMVLVEAQACGKPVVAGDSGGTRETMEVGVTGEIIDCSSPDRLATQLTRVLDNDALNSFGASGLNHVNATLDWKAHVIKAQQLFSK